MPMQYGYGYGAGYDYYGGYGAYAAYGYPPRGMGYPMGARGMRGGGRFPARGGRFGFRGGRGMGGAYMQPGGQPGESSGLQVRHGDSSSRAAATGRRQWFGLSLVRGGRGLAMGHTAVGAQRGAYGPHQGLLTAAAAGSKRVLVGRGSQVNQVRSLQTVLAVGSCRWQCDGQTAAAAGDLGAPGGFWLLLLAVLGWQVSSRRSGIRACARQLACRSRTTSAAASRCVPTSGGAARAAAVLSPAAAAQLQPAQIFQLQQC